VKGKTIEMRNKRKRPEERNPPRNRNDLDFARKAEAEKQTKITIVPKKAVPRMVGSISIARATKGPREHPMRVAKPRRSENL